MPSTTAQALHDSSTCTAPMTDRSRRARLQSTPGVNSMNERMTGAPSAGHGLGQAVADAEITASLPGFGQGAEFEGMTARV